MRCEGRGVRRKNCQFNVGACHDVKFYLIGQFIVAKINRIIARMAGKYKIVMVRHGESEWNQKNLFCGWFDANLSEKGMNTSYSYMCINHLIML